MMLGKDKMTEENWVNTNDNKQHIHIYKYILYMNITFLQKMMLYSVGVVQTLSQVILYQVIARGNRKYIQLLKYICICIQMCVYIFIPQKAREKIELNFNLFKSEE